MHVERFVSKTYNQLMIARLVAFLLDVFFSCPGFPPRRRGRVHAQLILGPSSPPVATLIVCAANSAGGCHHLSCHEPLGSTKKMSEPYDREPMRILFLFLS